MLFGSIGTLVETSEIQRKSFNEAFKKKGLNWYWTKEEYIKKAINFSADIEKLSQIRNGLRKKSLSSPVFDSDEFSKDFGEMLSGLWRNFKS